ncbi:hypothetical protein GY45DRAFT_1376237 [Cubamyces sp. BRFM 1775]|nr:hypothetical protein GY45DRAFT_1376237 [Cubamyces sp. BRFM 1775]
MIEPETPITIVMKHTHYPAFLLASDEGKPLKPSSVILRHRHLRQQQRVLQGLPSNDLPAAKPTRGTSVALPADVDIADASRVRSPPTDDRAGVVSPRTTPHDASHASAQIGQVPAQPVSHDTTVGDPGTSAIASGSSGASPPASTALHPLRPASFPEPAEPSSKSPWTGLNVVRHERSIRSRNDKTTWFASSGSSLLQTPPKIPLARVCDLYVHTSASGDKQAWILASTLEWVSVDLGHPHPYLKGYLLNFCANGEPSWVTKDTVRTYKGRTKKRTNRVASPGAHQVSSTHTPT